MGVQPGHDWGRAAPVPAGAVEVGSDAEAAAVVAAAREAGRRPPPLVLRAGDLARTLGLGAPTGGSAGTTAVAVDLGVAVLDGSPRAFVAHLVARRSWWWGPVVGVMNAQYLGRWDVAPRAHPGDGRLDVVEADLAPGDRWKARGRLPSGTHVPHPAIRQQRTARWGRTFDRPIPVRLDGVRVGRVRRVDVHVEPDALTVVV